MRARSFVPAALAAIAALSTVPAGAAPGDCRVIRGADTPDVLTDDVSACRQDVWFHRGTTPVANLAGQGADTVPGWNTTKPTTAFGAGGGAHVALAPYDALLAQDSNGRAIFRGTFTGVIDTVAFQAYMRVPVQETLGSAWPAVTYLNIDGEPIYDNFPSAANNLPVKGAGNFRRVDGVFTNVYTAMQSAGLDLTPSKVHSIEVALVPWYFGDSHDVLFFDASDAPSGLVFNLEDENMTGFTMIDTYPEEV